jgi:hypothetical protein
MNSMTKATLTKNWKRDLKKLRLSLKKNRKLIAWIWIKINKAEKRRQNMQKITNLKIKRNHQMKALISKSTIIKKLHFLIREKKKSLIHYPQIRGRLKKRQIIVYQTEIHKHKNIWIQNKARLSTNWISIQKRLHVLRSISNFVKIKCSGWRIL